jgi:hypothetical protein
MGGTKIYDGAFANCNRLTSITLPVGMHTLGSRAFAGCSNLTSVFFMGDLNYFNAGNTLTSTISVKAFTNTDGTLINNKLEIYGPEKRIDGLGDIVDSYISDYCGKIAETPANGGYNYDIEKFFSWKSTLADLETQGLEVSFDAINQHYYVSGYTGTAEKIIIPSVIYSFVDEQTIYYPVREITAYALQNNSTLKEIILTESITAIRKYAFAHMSNLVSITIPKSVKEIGEYTFIDNPKLTEIYFEGDVENIGKGIFTKNLLETKVYGPNMGNVKDYFIDSVMYSSYVKYNSTVDPRYLIVTLNSDETAYTVAGLKNKTVGNHVSVVLPAYYKGLPIKAIGATAFNNIDTLYELFIPKTIQSIASGAFKGCSSLSEIEVDTMNGYYAFSEGALTDYLTASIMYICLTVNKTYTLPETIKVIKNGAFDGSGIETLDFNTAVEEIEPGAFKGADNLKYITNVLHSAYFSYENGALYNKDKDTLFIYLYTNTAKSFDVPDTVVKVGDGAFENARSLEQIDLIMMPKSVKAYSTEPMSSCTESAIVIRLSALVFMTAWSSTVRYRSIVMQ